MFHGRRSRSLLRFMYSYVLPSDTIHYRESRPSNDSTHSRCHFEWALNNTIAIMLEICVVLDLSASM
jgi:hypothetical protein